MKLPPKLVEDLILEVADKEALELIRYIENKKNVSEFKIAEYLKMNINKTRNVLYRLNEHNLVSSTRKKDKKKGWYIYYWTFNPEYARVLAIDLKRKRIEDLRKRLKREGNEIFFLCQNECIRLDYNTAMEYGFRCPECGELMVEQKNEKIIDKIKVEVERLEKELEEELSRVIKKAPVKEVKKKKVVKKIDKKVKVVKKAKAKVKLKKPPKKKKAIKKIIHKKKIISKKKIKKR